MAKDTDLAKAIESVENAIWVFHCCSGSCNGCDIEIVALLTPRYDVERFGIKLVGTPRHADVILFTGGVTRKMEDKVRRIWDQTPDPKVALIVGHCGATGGAFTPSYHTVGPVDAVLPKDAIKVYVPGCPPRPEAITWGVVKAWLKLEELRGVKA